MPLVFRYNYKLLSENESYLKVHLELEVTYNVLPQCIITISSILKSINSK